jgi:hypothetical protein
MLMEVMEYGNNWKCMLSYGILSSLGLRIQTFVIASSKLDIRTSEQWKIAIISHIHEMVPIFHSHLIVFQNFGDILNTILYYEEGITIFVDT